MSSIDPNKNEEHEKERQLLYKVAGVLLLAGLIVIFSTPDFLLGQASRALALMLFIAAAVVFSWGVYHGTK